MPPPAQTDESSFNATDLTSAMLLAATGGLLDAIVFLDHGHVFANAMTGNVIFMAISVIQQDWHQAARHIAPITAFLLGVIAASLIRKTPLRHAALLVLLLEASGLLCIGLLPASFPQLAYTATVAFVSAFQVATFRRVGRFTYNSTFVTGNLRMVAEGFFDWHFAPVSGAHPGARSKGRAQFLKLAAICASFLLGALAGAFVAPRFPVHGILFAEPTLLIALLLTLSAAPSTPTRS